MVLEGFSIAGQPQICQSYYKRYKVPLHSIKPAEGDGLILIVHRMEVLGSDSECLNCIIFFFKFYYCVETSFFPTPPPRASCLSTAHARRASPRSAAAPTPTRIITSPACRPRMSLMRKPGCFSQAVIIKNANYGLNDFPALGNTNTRGLWLSQGTKPPKGGL